MAVISAFALFLNLIVFASPSFASSRGSTALLSHDDESLTSILSKKPSTTSETKFCSLANRACSSDLNSFKPFATVYKVYNNADEYPVTAKADSSLFFRQSALKSGNKIKFSKSQKEFPERALFWIQVMKTGYAHKELQKLLSKSFATSGTTKEAIKSILLKYCKAPSLKGSSSEFKICAKSLDEMVEFSKTALSSKQTAALSTENVKVRPGEELQIGNVKKMKADQIVSCHGVLLDSATYICHLISTTEVDVVEVIEAETKAPVNTVLAICHKDTSTWSEDHVAFKILKSCPGKIEACHWNTDLDLVWVAHD